LFHELFRLIRLPVSGKRNVFYQFRKITGFLPGRVELYELATTHKSACISLPDGTSLNNERLEFLGDAILNAIIADYLYVQFPGSDEGFLTQLRSKIVKRKELNRLAYLLGISGLIITNKNQRQEKVNILGNALEAIIGATYLDKGYYRAKKFVISKILIKHLDLERLARKESDFKSRIIEWAQKNKKEISFMNEETSDGGRDTVFYSRVVLQDQELGSGTGYSKKDAEQRAAEEALEKITH
jgi:ribonuclease-3